ncbi:hypothetical protein ACFPFV_00715 [Salinicoccus siamensis]|uniref:hypothetical protein n=1 Tax=Salinicoccus siamensis TaxID=381830 RepID=UPI003605E1E1
MSLPLFNLTDSSCVKGALTIAIHTSSEKEAAYPKGYAASRMSSLFSGSACFPLPRPFHLGAGLHRLR